MKKKLVWLLLYFIITTFTLFAQEPDSSLTKYPIIPQPQSNFTVYKIRPHIFLIRESACFEEVNCYLFVGKDRCLLFDSGLGIGNIKEVIAGITNLPVIVLNSHTHYDHINGNHLFDSIAGLNNDYSKLNAKGLLHDAFISFYKLAYLPSVSTVSCIPADYSIHPFSITRLVNDRDKIDLGGISLEVLNTPGHTPDGICLLDQKDSLLFSGDILYKGTLFLHLPESNFTDFTNSITRLNALKPSIKSIMPAHGPVDLEASAIPRLAENVGEIKNGKAGFTDVNGVHLYNFTFFKFLIK
jgi:glyoxylase-like metal-dependent hydrolase (beta-lactamase superfamily II)